MRPADYICFLIKVSISFSIDKNLLLYLWPPFKLVYVRVCACAQGCAAPEILCKFVYVHMSTCGHVDIFHSAFCPVWLLNLKKKSLRWFDIDRITQCWPTAMICSYSLPTHLLSSVWVLAQWSVGGIIHLSVHVVVLRWVGGHFLFCNEGKSHEWTKFPGMRVNFNTILLAGCPVIEMLLVIGL